jgi:tellurite methyltransferase
MTDANRAGWEARFRASESPPAPEPVVVEMMPLLPRGLALDVAAGSGRHGLLLARCGFRVVAIDYAESGLRLMQASARAHRLAVWPVMADLGTFPLPRHRFDAVLNVNFLDRSLVPRLVASLKPGGAILFDTFLVDQAEIGHPRNPDFLLRRYELREMLFGMELVRYQEGLVIYPNAERAWRATALAVQRGK